MLQLDNDTPFAAQLGLFTDHEGHQLASVVLKATFAVPGQEGVCRPAPEQLPVLSEPTYTGDTGESSIRYPADLVPEKPGTDVVFVGHAYPPNLRPLTELTSHIEVGPLRKTIAVVGDRKWVPSFFGMVMSRPVAFERMPITYERAYGGRSPRLDERNPVGTGYCKARRDAYDMPLPNLEDPQLRIESWRQRWPVVGLGAIDAHWIPRRQWAGTYDAKWQAERCPVLPRDFDPRFHCVGAEGLRSAAPLQGELLVTLVHLALEPVLRFRLPGFRVGMDFFVEGELKRHEAELWTVIVEPDELRVVMVWGASCPIGKRPAGLSHVAITTEGI